MVGVALLEGERDPELLVLGVAGPGDGGDDVEPAGVTLTVALVDAADVTCSCLHDR